MTQPVNAAASSDFDALLRDLFLHSREMRGERVDAIAWNVGAMLMVTEVPLLRHVFHSTPLDARPWRACLLVSFAILLVGEAAKPALKLIPRTEGSR